MIDVVTFNKQTVVSDFVKISQLSTSFRIPLLNC